VLTVGRHAAADGAAVDPVVAAALEHRGDGTSGPRHGADRSEVTESPVGWPAPDPRPAGPGEGDAPVGWPGSMPQEPPPVPAPPRGWRRLFGGGRAA
jgi:hypothetical protein